MSSTRSSLSRTAAALLAVATATALTACQTSADAATASDDESCAESRDDAALLPEGLENGSRLFVTTYRSYIVQVTCGRLELVEPTGFDSCYFLNDDDVVRYPC